MSVKDDINEFVAEKAAEKDLVPDRAFIHWFLSEMEDFSEEELELIVTDGSGDGGADAVYYDEENDVLKIYQFKYSNDFEYVSRGYADLSNSLKNRQDVKDFLRSAKKLELFLVTTCDNHDGLVAIQNNHKRSTKGFLTRSGYRIELEYELFDLKRFSQFFEKLYGVDLSLEFKNKLVQEGNAFYGLVNANGFREHIEKEELLAFNIRKFLGIRKGSVNYKIYETLMEQVNKDKFWNLNNGIVCLITSSNVLESTDYKGLYQSLSSFKEIGLINKNEYQEKLQVLIEKDENNTIEQNYYTFSFSNFTIVNGAQTISTISKYLNAMPSEQDDPIWVLCKIITVSDDSDLEGAINITKASNTQNPANTKDLRAVDTSHRRISEWLDRYFDTQYIFRRGQKRVRNKASVDMKELAQAFTAFNIERPDVSFANVGKIFSDTEDFYSIIFPEEEIQELKESGNEDEITAFLIDRLVPYKMLKVVREKVSQRVQDLELDIKWKSLTYHLIWLYKKLLTQKTFSIDLFLDNHEEVIDSTFEDIFDTLYDFLLDNGDVPKILKTDDLHTNLLMGASFLSKSRIVRALKTFDKYRNSGNL